MWVVKVFCIVTCGFLIGCFYSQGSLSYASEAWVRCYGQKFSEIGRNTYKSDFEPDIKLWINELSNIELSLIETGKPAKMIDNSNDRPTNPKEQYFLLPGSVQISQNEEVYLVQPITYDNLIKLCVHTLNRGYGRKSKGFPKIERGYILFNMKASLARPSWWLSKKEYPIYRMDEYRPDILNDVPFNVESEKYPAKRMRELGIMMKFFNTLEKINQEAKK